MIQAEIKEIAEIEEASDRFYSALNRMFNGDVKPMYEVWSHARNVTQMGPFAGVQPYAFAS
jgi:hypothetical protein